MNMNVKHHKLRMKDYIEERSSQLVCNLFNSCKKNAWKNSGLNGIQTHYLCDAGAVPYQLSYHANWIIKRKPGTWQLNPAELLYFDCTVERETGHHEVVRKLSQTVLKTFIAKWHWYDV